MNCFEYVLAVYVYVHGVYVLAMYVHGVYVYGVYVYVLAVYVHGVYVLGMGWEAQRSSSIERLYIGCMHVIIIASFSAIPSFYSSV